METTQKNHKLLLGAHISASGGLHKAFARGIDVGCSTMQIFTKSNQQWYAKSLSDDEVDLFLRTKTEFAAKINPVIAHAAYLINVCSDKREIEQKSIAGLVVELERCQRLEIPYLVIHPGSSGSNDQKTGLRQLQKNLDLILQGASGTTKIVLENMAGQGSSVGHTIQSLAEIFTKSSYKKYLGLCIDTCHAFAAGYNIAEQEILQEFITQIDAEIGLDRLCVFHLNDSKYDLGAKKDRHADIGKGEIGLNLFSWIMNDPRFFHIPKIIETPHDNPEDDKRNLIVLKNTVQNNTQQ